MISWFHDRGSYARQGTSSKFTPERDKKLGIIHMERIFGNLEFSNAQAELVGGLEPWIREMICDRLELLQKVWWELYHIYIA